MPRIILLDLLRGFAALSVAIAHYFSVNSADEKIAKAVSILSVEIFFVLSGFVLGSQIVYCVRSEQARNLGTFLVRRWMRTVPPYLLALFVITYLTGQLGTTDFLRYALYIQNFSAQHNVTDYFPVAWSLSVEEWFYVIFPGLLFVVARIHGRDNRRFLIGATLAFIAVIVLLRTLHGWHTDWDAEIRRVAVFRLDAIACGFALFLLIGALETHGYSRFTRNALYPAVLFVVLAAAGFAVTLMAGASVVAAQVLFCFLAPAFGMAAVLLFYSIRPAARQGRFAQACRYLGQVSYSIYLFHLIAIIVLKPHLAGFGVPAQIAIYLGCVFAVATLIYQFFEKPILDARPEYSQVRSAPAAEERQFA